DLADAVCVRFDDAYLHPGQRFADGVGTEGMQVVNGDGSAGFGQAIAIRDGNAEVVKKLQRLRFAEGPTDDDRAQFASEIVVNLLQQQTAEAQARMVFRQSFVDCNERVENSAFARRQFVEARLQPFLQIFQN